ncbi:MAG: hypothetical protein WD737_08695 [Gemmatimonadota bacterium]
MTRARSVLLILFLLAGSLSPPGSHAQESPPALQSAENTRGFVLEQNYPNPVNPETWIPFTLEPSLFDDGGSVAATVRIYNILSQVIAIPEAIDHPRGRGAQLINLAYSEPGRQIAYWNGRDQSGRPVPSGVYYVQMVVEGVSEPQTRKLTVLNPRSRRRIFPW